MKKVIFFSVFLVFLCFGLLAGCGDSSVNSLGGDATSSDVYIKYCKNNAQCGVDEECKNNVCVKKETGICRNKTDCKADEDCIGGKCVSVASDGGIDGSLDIGDADNQKRGKISADPATIEFGAMRFGEKKEKSVRILNIGDAPLKIYKIELDPNTDSKTFGFKTDFAFGSLLEAGGEFEINITCQQNDEKPDSGDLLISSDDEDTPIFRIKMKNSYKDKPDISVEYLDSNGNKDLYPKEGSPNNELSIDMGNVPLGEKRSEVIRIINVAEESIVSISDLKFDIYNNNKTNVNQFAAVLKDSVEGSEISLPVYLSPQDSIVIIVEYNATNEALEDKYSISVKTNDLDINNDNDTKENGLLIINLKAKAGYKDPELSVVDLNNNDLLSSGIDFGEVEIRTTSKKLFKICNSGGGNLIIDKESGLDNTQNFSLNPENLEASLVNGQCINNIELNFTPSSVGEAKCTLKIKSNDPVKPEAKLNIKGRGINSEMRVNPLNVDFGDVLVNSTATPVYIEIKNIGDGTLYIYSIEFGAGSSKDFYLSNLPLSFPAKLMYNESINFSVGFKPTSLGVKNGVIVITSSDTDNLSIQIPITGNGSNCDSDHADCNQDPSDGCEVDLRNDVNNCGGCGNKCELSNANAICENKKCKIESCIGSYLDCNNDARDGCEINKLNDKNNCGTCNNVCGDHSSCQNGICVCDSGYLNCDNDFATNGCEVDKNSDPKNCGSCNYNCGANSVCISGNCSCQPDYKNCNLDLSDGCEVNIKTNPNNCGDCNVRCGNNAYCNNGVCNCNDGYGNCNGDWFDGCEKYLMTDKYNCGVCGRVCTNLPNASGSCVMGDCKYTCISPYKDCDGNIDNGCESNPDNDPNNCGYCGNKCGNNMECVAGQCRCKSGFADCDGNIQNGCEANLASDNNNCGACNNKCNNNAYCSNSSCTCNTNYANCNGLWSDGCEIYLPMDVYNCGSCGNDCTKLPNVASASCTNSICQINACNTDTANCDSNVNNGCEINHSVYANSCATASFVGSICGDDGTPSLGPFEGTGSKWFKVTIKECDSGIFADPLAAQIFLDVPDAPQDYDLVVYDSCGSTANSFPKGPGVDESIWVYKDDVQCWPGNCDDTFDLYIEVRYIGGGTNQCAKWYLTINSNDSWY